MPKCWYGKGIVENADLLPDLDEADRPRRDEQLGLQRAVGRHDLQLQALRIGRLSDRSLQRGNAAGDRRPDDIGPAAIHFGDALLDRRQLVAQGLDLFRLDERKLLKVEAGLGELALPRRPPAGPAYSAPGAAPAAPPPGASDPVRRPGRAAQLGARGDDPPDQLDALRCTLICAVMIAQLDLETLHLRVQAVPLGGCAALFRGNLAAERLLLLLRRGQDRGVDVLAIGRDLGGRDRQQRLALLDGWPCST